MRRTSSKPTEDKKPAPVRKRAEDSEISVPRKQLKTVATSAQASPQLWKSMIQLRMLVAVLWTQNTPSSAVLSVVRVRLFMLYFAVK